MSDYTQRNTDYWRGRQDELEAKRRFSEPPTVTTVSRPITTASDIPALLEHLKQLDEENWDKLIANKT